ncbi:MAG: DNA replication protein DnaD, partial [Oscillospiraceae bacterium]|nr:DNA replication protein DnaD [Oscillospiraceae bacterium]
MKYMVNWGGGDGVFAVPDFAADCLKLASGKAVKLLLYILKNKITDIDFGAFSNALDISAEDAEDAVSYWQQVGVL